MSLTKSSLLKVLCCFFPLTLSACDMNKTSEESSPQDLVTEAVQSGSLNVPLEEVAETKCLNLEKYFGKVQNFPRETRVRKLATDFRLLSGNTLPRNFYYRLVAGNFQILDMTLAETPDFPVMKQDGCNSVTFSQEGYSETYQIISGNRNSVTFKNEWGGQTTVTWKSPMSVEFDHVSNVTDDLCDRGSKGRILVTHQINWGDDSIYQENLPAESVSQNFLNIVTNAKGSSLNSLYTSPVFSEPPAFQPEIPDKPQNPENPAIPEVIEGIQTVDSKPQLLVSRLKQLQALPVRSELLQCY